MTAAGWLGLQGRASGLPGLPLPEPRLELKGRLEQIEQRARVVETLAKEGQACIVCGTLTDLTFFCPCDLTHALCSDHQSIERKDCAHIVPLPKMLGETISWAEARRISQDGP